MRYGQARRAQALLAHLPASPRRLILKCLCFFSQRQGAQESQLQAGQAHPLVDARDRTVASASWRCVPMRQRSQSGATTSRGRQYQSKSSSDCPRAARSRRARSSVSSWYDFAAAAATAANLMDHSPAGAGGR